MWLFRRKKKQRGKLLLYIKEFRLYSIANKDPLRILAQRSDIGKVIFEMSQKTLVIV